MNQLREAARMALATLRKLHREPHLLVSMKAWGDASATESMAALVAALALPDAPEPLTHAELAAVIGASENIEGHILPFCFAREIEAAIHAKLEARHEIPAQ